MPCPTPSRVFRLSAIAALCLSYGSTQAEGLTLLHVGDQESWLISAQGNLRDDAAQGLSYYGGVDRLASVIKAAELSAEAAGHTVLKLNAGDAFLPGPRWNASKANLATAYTDGGQDFYDAIAMRAIGFDATVFGNHEFDEGAVTAARFASVSGTTYLSSNLDFGSTSEFSALASAGVVKPYTLVTTTGGKTVALVGATTPLLPKISSPGSLGLINFNAAATDQQNLVSLASTIQTNVDAARAAGATAVVLMSHLQDWNNEKNTVVPLLRGVDVVLSGGGHELMANDDDALIPTGAPAFGPGRDIAGLPQMVQDADGRSVAVVTSNFGNRYVGQLSLTLDDITGKVTAIGDASLLRVSGYSSDADKVVGDSFVKAAVVDPVMNYIAVLNATQIGVSQVALSGSVKGTTGSPGSFVAGVRNSETNMGDLAADALRFTGGSDVAIQNGGGIRADIAAGAVTMGDTFNVLPFTNLVQTAKNVSAEQLKALMEHSVAKASTSGAADGRFAQVSGMRVVYDTTRAAGSRVLSITLDDGTRLVVDGAVVTGARSVSMSTIDFTANGGDGYPFLNLGLDFVNLPDSITYQESLANYISAPVSEGGLGGVISAQMYGAQTPFDVAGRLVDAGITPVPEPATYALMFGGLGIVGWLARRRRVATA